MVRLDDRLFAFYSTTYWWHLPPWGLLFQFVNLWIQRQHVLMIRSDVLWNHAAKDVLPWTRRLGSILFLLLVYIYLYICILCIYITPVIIFHVVWAYYGLVRYHYSMIHTQCIEYYLFTSPHFGTSTDMSQPLSPLSRFARNFLTEKTQFLSLTVSFKRTQTKTNNCTTIYLRSQYTLFAITFHLFHPIYPTLLFRTTIVDCYNATDQIR